MQIGITSIQRDRGPYIIEWIAFHLTVGVNKFYIYNHGEDPLQRYILLKLSQKLPEIITVHDVDINIDRPQIVAYNHSWENYKNSCDAMAFIDGDEFLFSPEGNLAAEIEKSFETPKSAIGVYWTIYGSNGHLDEPSGLIIENYPRHSKINFDLNCHIKTIMRKGESATIEHSHFFHTAHGTFDELNRSITGPIMSNQISSSKKIRLNHYATQSYEYFLNKKKYSGQADLNHANIYIRTDDWFHQCDRNECDDGLIYNHIIKTKIKINQLKELINS